ncbi:MAG: hypothetical protein ACREJN_12460 [Nitrospiraceae bacterium]
MKSKRRADADQTLHGLSKRQSAVDETSRDQRETPSMILQRTGNREGAAKERTRLRAGDPDLLTAGNRYE